MPSTSVLCLYLNKASQSWKSRLTQKSYALGLRQAMYKSKLKSKVGTLLPISLRQAERPTSSNYHARGTLAQMEPTKAGTVYKGTVVVETKVK